MAQERRGKKPILALGIKSSHIEIDFSLIDRNPNQPREDFDDDGDIQDLAESIESNTLLQAVTVRKHPDVSGRYMIVAGERRFRAMNKIGMTKEVFKFIDGPGVKRSYILSAIENIHRVNLNPIEEAKTYERLHDEEHLTWEEIADLLGRDISVIITKMKLLTLPPEIQEMVRKGNLPQVRALNLAQWRNEQGDYLRMAHDLIAGRDTAETHFRRETVRGQRLVQAKLPKTAEDFASRIVKLSGHVQSMPAVLEALLSLTPEQQVRVFEAIHPSVFGKLRVRFVALYRATQAVSEQMNAFDAARSKRGYIPSLLPTPDSQSAERRAEAALALSPTPSRPTPPPPPRPSGPTSLPRNSVDHRPASPRSEAAPHTPSSPPTGGSAPLKVKDEGPEKHDLGLSHRVLTALFYSGGFRRVDLSKIRLRNSLGSDGAGNLEQLVRNSLSVARDYWRDEPKGSELKIKFIRLANKLRRDFGNPSKFDDLLRNALGEDKSSDPISLFLK